MCAWCVYMCACLYAYTDANTISFYTFVNLYKYLLIYIWFLKIYVKKSCCINKGVNKCSMAFFIIGIYIYIVYSFLRQQNPYSECIHARMACILVCAIVRTHACMYIRETTNCRGDTRITSMVWLKSMVCRFSHHPTQWFWWEHCMSYELSSLAKQMVNSLGSIPFPQVHHNQDLIATPSELDMQSLIVW